MNLNQEQAETMLTVVKVQAPFWEMQVISRTAGRQTFYKRAVNLQLA